MKVLVVCEGALVRSVIIAALLKFEHGHDALAASLRYNTPDTLRMLRNWADRVIVVEPWMRDVLYPPTEEDNTFREACWVWDLGPDRWGTPIHPELQALVRHHIAHSSLKGTAE